MAPLVAASLSATRREEKAEVALGDGLASTRASGRLEGGQGTDRLLLKDAIRHSSLQPLPMMNGAGHGARAARRSMASVRCAPHFSGGAQILEA